VVVVEHLQHLIEQQQEVEDKNKLKL
jgi:hypothetical protein